MATILRTDPERGPGFARLCLEAGATPLPSMPEGCAFTLQRASDALFLAHSGWQESQSELTPEALERQGPLLTLNLGPVVVDNLDILNTYRIHLRHTALPASVITIESLDYSPLKGKQGLHIHSPVAAAPALSPVAATPTEAVAEAPAPEAPIVEAPQTPPENSPPLSMSAEEAPPPKNKSIALWIVALLILGLGAAAALYWYTQQADKPVAEAPASAPSPAPAPSPASPPLSAMAQARQHLQAQGDPAQGLALAQQLQTQQSADSAADAATQSQRADAIFLLVEDAAQKGQGEAMILLARYFDPVDKAPKGSIHSDPQQAMHWYTLARAAGQSPAADSGINALRQWATTAAAAGDKAAQELLRTP